MAANISFVSPLSKITDMIFSRATPKLAAEQSLSARLITWHRQRQAEADLARLSDRELADIGLTRQTIASAVRQPRL